MHKSKLVKSTLGTAQEQRDGAPRPSAEQRQVLDLEQLLTIPIDEALHALNTSTSGLTAAEARNRLRVFGPNELAKRKRITGVVKFLFQFRNPLIIILLLAGAVSALFGEVPNAVIIFSMVLFSVVLLFYQESKAEQSAEKLKEKVTTTATVVRDGITNEVRLSEIVPGDVIHLSAGDIVPADARVISAKDLFLNQAALTGESFPVEKIVQPPRILGPTLTDWTDCLFMGTSVVNGVSTAVVLKTGSSTEYGKIAKSLVAREPETDFERGLRRFGFLIMEVTILLVIFVFFINGLFRRGILESLLFAVALAVGLTPELLPMILSVNLSRGAVAMSKKGVIVKRLSSIQNFGSMDVLCTDKTGTLTENKITLVLHIDAEGNENEKVLLYSYLNSHNQTGLKSPLDEAILAHKKVDIRGFEKVDEIPFDFARKRLSVVVESNRRYILISKGAPEEILKICSSCELAGVMKELDRASRKKIEKKYYDLSLEGFRVLGVSYREIRETKAVYSTIDEAEMVFLGFIAFIDPPKTSAKESLALLERYGISLKILTGDNELVARKVCGELDFEITETVLGSELDQMHDDALALVVERANLFARVNPAQKSRIINALKRNGHVVGFLGDGINDAPSMHISDVGISVENAVDVAKESADIILLQKSLKVLNDGVLEGRRTFGNTLKYVMMGISSNFGNMFSAAGASLFLPFLPMLPTQILLNNLLYDFSESTIPTDKVDSEYVEKPKKWDISYIRTFMVLFGLISSIFDFLTFLLMLTIFRANAPLFQTAWFIESFCTESLVIFVIRTRLSPFYKSKPSTLLLLSTLAMVAIALVIPISPLGKLFQFVEPPPIFFAFLAGYIVTYLALVEVAKIWFYKHHGAQLDRVARPFR